MTMRRASPCKPIEDAAEKCVFGLGQLIPGNVPNPNPLGEEVGSVGRLAKRILIEALVLAAPLVWRKVRERRRGKN